MIAGILMIGILSGLTGSIMALMSGFGLLTSSLIYVPGGLLGALIAILAMTAWQYLPIPVTARPRGTTPLAVPADSPLPRP